MAQELVTTPFFSDANLVAYYRLEANANDSKDSYNGTDYNVPSYGAAKFGNGVTYNGIDEYMRCASDYGMTYASSRSISMWIKMVAEPTSGNSVILGGETFDTNPGNYTWFFYENNAGVYRLHNNAAAEKSGQLGTTDWHHVVLTHNHSGNVTKIYVDGVIGTNGTSFTGDYTADVTAFYLGAMEAPAAGYFANCIIDDAAIFNDILTDAEVLAIYSANYSGFFAIL